MTACEQTRKALLSSLMLFHGVSLDAIEGLLEDCALHCLEAGEVLLTPGQPNHTVYLLISGRLSIRLESLTNPPISYIEVGESVGEMSVIEGTKVSAYAMVDALTGLHNRRWLDEMLKRQLSRCSEDSKPLALLLIDVDHFKQYNDRHGHIAGDWALRAVARTLAEQLRPSDTVARYGGEEFLIVLPDTDAQGARTTAERIRAAISQAPVMTLDGTALPPVTVSLGLAQMMMQETPEQLLARTDAALYRAKAGGRNRVCD